jgi:serine/threonine protein kinase
MAVTPGSRIGAYEVTSQLGEGGMGVVFRARDTRLLRDVAIKLLPDHFADDPDRLSRLQREAQLLASLNHPNIAQIYGLEQVGNAGCIVMELVEGDTLGDRLKNGPFPLDESLEIAKQIADALAAAHERGIVHRDLKPANIKLTPRGKVKVLDFGLAKALETNTPEPELSSLPTKVSGSMVGAVIGTPAYMSPEQARGREVDARTDIWAFGCVLYEMLTGRQTFAAETTTDMIAKIVTVEPDLNLLPSGTPSSVRLLLEATLNKNAQQRLQHIGDMRLFLDEKFFPRDALAAARAAGEQRKRGAWLIASTAAVLALVLVGAGFYFRSSPPPPATEMHFEVALPNIISFPSVSPDGQRIAFVAQPPDEPRSIWIRSIGSDSVQKLPRSENATTNMFWSPDSRFLAFIADGKLNKADIDNGASQVLCDAIGPIRGFSWNRDGVILLSKDNVIVRVSDQGGAVVPVTKLDETKKEQFHGGPVFLPDGKQFLYIIASAGPDNSGIFVRSLESSSSTRIMPWPGPITGLAYSSGYLLTSLGNVARAFRFDANKLTLDSQPYPIAEGLEGGFSISDSGLLLYRKAATAPPTKQLLWFDRMGRQVGQVGTAANYGNVDISPSGDRVAVDLNTNGNRDIWVIDIARGVPSRITFEPGADWSASWSADGTKLMFASTRKGTTHIYQKAASGVGVDELVFNTDKSEIPVFWSHDGRHVAFSRPRIGSNNASYDTWVLDTSEHKDAPFVESPFDKAQGRISPDGRWIAYATNDSGMYQIVVQSFPDPNGGKWQITAQGGVEPKWRHDGRELYYLGFDGKLMAVPVKGERSFEAGTPSVLFETPLVVSRTLNTRDRRYDVAPDGRFLLAVPTGNNAPAPTVAIVNWAAGLAKK